VASSKALLINPHSALPKAVSPLVERREQGRETWLDRPPMKETFSAVYLLAGEAFRDIYSLRERASIASRVKIDQQLITPEAYLQSSTVWPEVEMIFSGWGMVLMDEVFLQRFPRLKVVFYAAGTVRSFVTDAFWARRILLTNAGAANAVPVCEFTISQILFALKHGWQKALHIRKHRKFPPRNQAPGAYETTVGLLSLGEIGRLVAERLQPYDLNVVAYDPYFPPEEAARLGIKMVSLDEVFIHSDVVSCHTPLISETDRMIRGAHFEMMKPGSTFLNTARGRVIAEEEMIAVLKMRPDIFALLDVTQNEEPAEHSPLYTLDNVVLTPHIAGSLGRECHRMGKLMTEELDRYLAREPLRYAIDEERFRRLA
jgi:phosphoglycerate dehydrogenase-like enzyme